MTKCFWTLNISVWVSEYCDKSNLVTAAQHWTIWSLHSPSVHSFLDNDNEEEISPMIGEGVLHFLFIHNHIFYHCTPNPGLHSSHSILLMKAPSVLSVLIVSCDQWFELWAVCIVNQSRRGVTFTGRVTLLFVQKDFYWAPTMPGLTNSASHVTLSRSLDITSKHLWILKSWIYSDRVT